MITRPRRLHAPPKKSYATASHPVNTFLKLIIVLKFRIFLDLPSCRSPLSFITEILYALLSSSTHLGILTFSSTKHN